MGQWQPTSPASEPMDELYEERPPFDWTRFHTDARFCVSLFGKMQGEKPWEHTEKCTHCGRPPKEHVQ
jgi:hypothetical protein